MVSSAGLTSGDSSEDGGELRDLVIGISPFTRPDARLVAALVRSGALGVLDLGHDEAAARRALADLGELVSAPFGVRVSPGCPLGPGDMPELARTVVVVGRQGGGEAVGESVGGWSPGGRRVLAEVRSVTDVRPALAAGASGLLVRGNESGGLVGEETAFVLLQRIVAELGAKTGEVPLFVAGGIGPHSAAAAIAGGASGVVLDSQLALVRESSLPDPLKAALRAMDGSETAVVGSHRVYVRPGTLAASLPVPASCEEVASLLGADDLATGLLAAGQDAALAAPLAARWPTASALVRGMRRQIAAHLGAASRRPGLLGPGSRLAASHGIRYPIAQGPMTRVSDRAAFARAVGEGGGLPFLALALMDGAEARALLLETKDAMGGMPFGAGILGFVPREVRAAQMEALLDARPPVALVAGGRPSQARPLEEAGIATYLHVPSPGLLDMFLGEGARRFVFEGRECGGHVGPRSSFALWDAQVERILALGLAAEVSVLFAGGIHDARSAAMVGALSATLVEARAAVGVLMGTSYLFTEEAVRTGAVLPGYQEVALSCEDTVLLETSPGHATRCAGTPYVDAFGDARERMEAAGTDQSEMWAALELLNLGRLRIASKGLARVARDGDRLVEVSPEEQLEQGMFMLGQVAALRRSTTTVAQLHHEVSAGSEDYLASLSPVAERIASGLSRSTATPRGGQRPAHTGQAYAAGGASGSASDGIAVVGIACVFPGAPDSAAYWANVLGARDSVGEVPPERFDVERYYDPGSFVSGAGRKTPSKWGGFLPGVGFDALGYGIPPRSLSSIEPVQLLSLEVAARALADAGYAPGTGRELDRERVSVVFGAEAGTDLASAYGFRSLAPQYLGALPAELDELLPELTEDSFPGLLTNVIAGRIANRLDLGGVNYTVDAACASSLAALDVASKELRAGTSDMVLCGGADLHNGVNDYLLFAAVHALSPTGRCASFDASADGIALGEGVACVVLKRVEDAVADGDRIYAVVEAVAGSSDGRSLGLTAPRPEGQRRALERAYSLAGIAPSEVGLVEAHGTGTVVGDRTELAVLSELFVEAGAGRGSCVLGSVKSQIGHTKCAAGLAGLIKAAKAVYHGVLPPSIHIEEPNPGYEPERSPFVFESAPRPWVGERRVAGVSAFGFGGTNFHAVLRSASPEESEPPGSGLERWPAELFLVRGETRGDAIGLAERLARHLAGLLSSAELRPSALLADLAAATWRAGRGPVRAALVASDLADLDTKLTSLRSTLGGELPGGTGPGKLTASIYVADDGQTGDAPDAGGTRPSAPAGPGVRPRVAFLFPGQGSQRPGMLSEWFVAFPRLRRHLRRQERYARLMLPPAAFGPEAAKAQAAALTDTRVAQPALGIAGLAAAELLASLGIEPDALGGHSYGELVALSVAGAIDPDDLVGLSAERAEAILGAAGDDPGSMAAVAAGADAVRAVLSGTSGISGEPPDDAGSGIDAVVVANDNSPGQVVISGGSAAVADAVSRLADAGLAAKRIPVACAFHSPVVAGASHAFAKHLAARNLRAPVVPVWSNVCAEPYLAEPVAVVAGLAAQVASPVRFREQVESMYEAGVRVFVEAGPGRVLTGLVRATLSGLPHAAVALDSSGRGDLQGLLGALAELAVNGVEIDASVLYEGRTCPLDLDAPPPAVPGWVVNGHLVRVTGGDVVPGALRPADERPVPAAPACFVPLAGTALEGAAYVNGSSPAGSSQAGSSPAGSSPAVRASSEREAVVADYLRSMREMVAAGRDVMLGYLGAPAAVQPALGVPDLQPADLQPAGQQPAEAQPAEPPGADGGETGPAPSRGAPLGADVLRQVLVGVVSEATGYPPDMLGPDLDLEADLSIDSIKRMEIVGALAERLGLASGDGTLEEAAVEELVGTKTLSGMVEWLLRAQEHLGEPGNLPPAPPVGAEVPVAGEVPATGELPAGEVRAGEEARVSGDDPLPDRALRFVPRLADAAPASEVPARELAESSVVVTDDGTGIASHLAAIIAPRCASVRLAGPADALGSLDVLVHLEGLAPSPEMPALGLFERSREAILSGATVIVAASATGGTFGMGNDAEPAPEPPRAHANGAGPGTANGAGPSAGGRMAGGMRGALKAIAAEMPGIAVRMVDLPTAPGAASLADMLAEEILAGDDLVEVARGAGRRRTVVLREETLPTPAGRGPLGDALGLGPDSVILATGGARGITARCVVALAELLRCRIVIAGRTPEPDGEEPPHLRAAADTPEIRRALVEAGERVPSAVEVALRRILAEREVRSTLATLRALVPSVEYRCIDVRDTPALQGLVGDLYRTYGRIDGVLHGAGTIEDARLADKTAESFRRVFDTKATSAEALVEALRPDVRFVVLFASVSGILGNAGQVDYAAANDYLADLARSLDRRIAGRALAVDWGPWDAVGMVSPELRSELTRRGVGLLDPSDAISQLVAELRSGVSEPEVVLMRSDPGRWSTPRRDHAGGHAVRG